MGAILLQVATLRADNRDGLLGMNEDLAVKFRRKLRFASYLESDSPLLLLGTLRHRIVQMQGFFRGIRGKLMITRNPGGLRPGSLGGLLTWYDQ